MLKRILVGYNGAQESEDAIALAGALAAGTGAAIEVLAVFPFDGVPPLKRQAALREACEPLFEKAGKEIAGIAPDIKVSTRGVSDSSAAGAMTNFAEAEGADLIVVGSTHRGTIGRVLPGSVGERLLSGAPCAVAVAPRGYAGHEHAAMASVGVGYDGRREARAALEIGADLTASLGGHLTVIGALSNEGPSAMFGGYPGVLRKDCEADLKEAGELISGRVEFDTVLEEGQAAAVLASVGVELDLIVIGSRGYGPIARTLLGGVSAELIRTSPCPVIVVPRSAEPEDEG